MKYWRLASIATLGGALLINGSLDEVLPLVARLEIMVGFVSLGAGRRMIQQKLH